MSDQSIAPPIEPAENIFFAALMDHLMQGSMIPKVQVERSVGPIIGFFLPEVLSAALEEEVVMLCPEFPIRKARLGDSENNQSTNIDWLMFSRDKQELLLVELKTTDTTYRHEQSDLYQTLQDTIAQRGSAAFLIDELQAIASASQESGKYRNVMALLAQALSVPESGLSQALGQCSRARIIYIAPKISKPGDWPENDASLSWFSFGDLPETIEHNFATHWPAVRASLVTLDTMSRRMRNGEQPGGQPGKNYRYLLSFDALLERCNELGSDLVVGLMNWRAALPAMTAAQLRAKTYKCDLATEGVGKKLDKNWIPGDQFLKQVAAILD